MSFHVQKFVTGLVEILPEPGKIEGAQKMQFSFYDKNCYCLVFWDNFSIIIISIVSIKLSLPSLPQNNQTVH